MSILGAAVARLIQFYQRYPRRPPYRVCGFEPTCSEYARLCFERMSFLRAARLTRLRLRRCTASLPLITDPPPER